MQYMLLIYGDLKVERTPEENQAEMSAYYAYTAEVRDRGMLISSEALYPTSSATTVTVRDSKTIITDGPFAETKEQLGGYYLLECKDLDEAIEFASKCPGSHDGKVEIRPVFVF